MEDYVKIPLLKKLGQSSAVTFKSLFSEPHRSTRINKMYFILNECKEGTEEDSKPATYGHLLSAVSTAPTTVHN